MGLAAVAAVVLSAPADATHAAPARCRLDLMLAVDTSGSMAGPYLANTQAGSTYFVGTLGPGDKSGLATTDSSSLRKVLDHDHSATTNAIATMTAGSGVSDVAGPIDAARIQFATNGQAGVRWVLVVLTDGEIGSGGISVATTVKAMGVEVFAIAVGPFADRATLRAIASDPDSLYYHEAVTSVEIAAAFETIAATMEDCTPRADFTAGVGCARTITIFTDTSVAAPRGRLASATWDFGDGSPRVTFAPPAATVAHVYAVPGVYTVRLNVTDAHGRHNDTARTIVVGPCPPVPPVAAFTCMPLGAALEMWFDESSRDTPPGELATWRWDFGDGTQRYGRDVRHTYAAEISYNVTLTVTDDEGLSHSVTRACLPLQSLPPVVLPLPNVTVHEHEKLVVPVAAIDPDGDVLALGWIPGALPASAQFDPHARRLTWTPHRGTAGLWGPVTITASDGWFIGSATFWITVLPLPDEPVPRGPDADGDGVPDAADNCPSVANADQADADGNGVADACAEPLLEPDACTGCASPPCECPESARADGDGAGDSTPRLRGADMLPVERVALEPAPALGIAWPLLGLGLAAVALMVVARRSRRSG